VTDLRDSDIPDLIHAYGAAVAAEEGTEEPFHAILNAIGRWAAQAAPVPAEPVAWQERQQNADGSWTDWYEVSARGRQGQPLRKSYGGIMYEWRPVYATPPQAHPAPSIPEKHMTDEQLNAAVDRFLWWRLPDTFAPDCGISFTKPNHPNSWPVGTDLFTATEAKEMLRCVLSAIPEAPAPSEAARQPGQYTHSEQRGTPGHCNLAQVFGPDGKSVASFDSTIYPAVATERARLTAIALSTPAAPSEAQQEAARAVVFPPLPAPAGRVFHDGGQYESDWVSSQDAYDADQMHNYAEAAVRASTPPAPEAPAVPAPQEPAKPVDAQREREDAARLDWLLHRLSGKELRRIGIETSSGGPLWGRVAIDAAMKGTP
jgi:hypothetical protein